MIVLGIDVFSFKWKWKSKIFLSVLINWTCYLWSIWVFLNIRKIRFLFWLDIFVPWNYKDVVLNRWTWSLTLPHIFTEADFVTAMALCICYVLQLWWLLFVIAVNSVVVFLMLIYFEREKTHSSVSRGEAEREERDNAKQALSFQHRADLMLDPMTVRSWPEPKSRVGHSTDWATQVPP